MVNNQPKRIQSVQRAIALVEAIAASDDGMRLQDLARSIGLTAGAAHHLVDTLAASGWVVRGSKPVRYRLGPALAELNGRHQQRRLMTVIDAEMLDLHRRLGGGSVSLCEATGNELMLTRGIGLDGHAAVIEPRGTILLPYTSAASLVHLAFWPEERSRAYRQQRSFTEYGAAMWGTIERLEEALRTARRAGHAVLPTQEPESLRIGVPVFGPGGGLVASLTLSAHHVDDPAAQLKRFVDEGLRTTQRIRERLPGEKP